MQRVLRWMIGLFLFTFLGGETRASTTVQVSILDPCSSHVVLHVERPLTQATSVGEITMDVLKSAGVLYEATVTGVHSLLGTPTGAAACEVVSPDHLRVYGWCYRVNGQLALGLTHEEILRPSAGPVSIEWFFGFARYRAGTWGDFCQPLDSLTARFICRPSASE